MAELDFSEGALPLYSQVAYGLCRRIKDGEFTVGSFLPSQSDLSSYYGVSRITIINAIRVLTEKGILRSHQGKGSLVLKSEIGVDSYVEEGFSMQVQKHGFSASTKVVSAKIVKASGDVLSSLMLKDGDSVIELKRIRYIDSVPACYEHTFYRIIPGITEAILTLKDNESLYALLSTKGVKMTKAEEKMWAEKADEESASLLGMVGCSPVLSVHRRTFAEGYSFPFEYCNNSYNTNVYGPYGIVTIKLQP